MRSDFAYSCCSNSNIKVVSTSDTKLQIFIFQDPYREFKVLSIEM